MFGMSWTFGTYGTFGICAIRHMRESERFRKYLTKSYRFDIIIVQRETLKNFNGKRWTGAARYVYNVYARKTRFSIVHNLFIVCLQFVHHLLCVFAIIAPSNKAKDTAL